MPPIKTNVRRALETAIDSMSTAGGYYFDWGVFNRDLALSDFPNYYITMPTEENLDFDSGETNAGAYDNMLIVEIKVNTKMQDSALDPQHSGEDELDKAEVDLKKLFADSGQIGTTMGGVGADSFMYMGYETNYHNSNDLYVPENRIFKFRLQYNQDRLDPDTIAC